MKFVEQHLTKHHFLHAPHKWFLAILLSPIHAAELHYQKIYHLRFAHARKLFLFDMFLVLCIFGAAGSWIFVSLYDPTVVKQVEFSLNSPNEKIKNGDPITYTVSYANKSKENLIDGHITFEIPPGFIFENSSPAEIFSSSTKTFVLSKIPPGSKGTVSIAGIFYGNMNEKISTVAHFSYKQETRGVLEEKVTTLSMTPRGSSLLTTLTASDEIINQGTTEITVSVKNTGEKPLREIALLFDTPSGILVAKDGKMSEKKFEIAGMIEPQDTRTFHFEFTPQGLAKDSETKIAVTPLIRIQNTSFLLDATVDHPWKVLTPEVNFGATIADASAYFLPEKNITANMSIKNNGNIALQNAVVSLNLPNFADAKLFSSLNHVTSDKTGFHITAKQNPSLAEIAPGGTVVLPLIIPIKNILSGNNIQFVLSPTLQATLKNTNSNFSENASTAPVKIGTKLTLDASVRYYTPEGDQLGRGPLPPRVGKETKYWALLRVSNSTSEVENVTLSAELPAYVQWTGRVSVTKGKEPSFNAATRLIEWNALSIAPGETAGIYAELSVTPTASQVGTTPILVKNISVSGKDTFIQESVNAKVNNVDVSLPGDAIARMKGVKVSE